MYTYVYIYISRNFRNNSKNGTSKHKNEFFKKNIAARVHKILAWGGKDWGWEDAVFTLSKTIRLCLIVQEQGRW